MQLRALPINWVNLIFHPTSLKSLLPGNLSQVFWLYYCKVWIFYCWFCQVLYYLFYSFVFRCIVHICKSILLWSFWTLIFFFYSKHFMTSITVEWWTAEWSITVTSLLLLWTLPLTEVLFTLSITNRCTCRHSLDQTKVLLLNCTHKSFSYNYEHIEFDCPCSHLHGLCFWNNTKITYL